MARKPTRARSDDEQERKEYDRPEGQLLAFVGPESDPKKYCVMVALSDFTGEDAVDVRTWVKLKNEKWVRTSRGVRFPLPKASSAMKRLSAFVEENVK